MRRSVLIVPETAGSDTWYRPYRDELKANSHHVWVAASAPDAEEASLDTWLDGRPGAGYREFFTGEDAVLVGHGGIGGAAVLGMLERQEQDEVVGHVVLVSAAAGIEPIRDSARIAAFTGGHDFDWPKISASVENITLIHALDDPEVSPQNLGEIIMQLIISPHYIHAETPGNGGHFTGMAGSSSPLPYLPKFEQS